MEQIAFNNSKARLITRNRHAVDAVYNALTFVIPGYEYTDKHEEEDWDGKISFFSLSNWTFPTGLLQIAKDALETKGFKTEIIDERVKEKNLNPDKIHPWYLNTNCLVPPLKPRDYQIDAIKSIFSKGRGIIQAPTGSGKTIIACAAIKTFHDHHNGKIKIGFFTHLKELLYQTSKNISEKTNLKVGLIGDGVCDTSKAVTVGLFQTLASRLKRKDPEIVDFLKSLDFIIIDEAHNAASDTWQSVCDACKNAFYRIALTATPLMKGEINDTKLQAITAGVIHRITLKDLIDRGLLAQPYVKYVRINKPVMNKFMPFTQAYHKGIVLNPFRNAAIFKEAQFFAEKGFQTLILVDQINHGSIILKELSKDYRCQFIHGSKTTDAREKAIQAIKNKEIDFLIASTIADEGLDLPALNAVILAGGKKSPVRLYQRIGRGMRIKTEGINAVYIVDFIDLHQRHLAKHSLQRYTTIKAEPGFEIVSNFEHVTIAVAA